MSLNFNITGNNDDFKKKLAESRKGIIDLGDEADSVSIQIEQSIKRAGGAIAGAFSVGAASMFVKKMYEVRSSFQDTESSMRVFLGSADKASKFMKELLDYAWYNMFEFSDLTEESTKLLAFGNDVESIIPTLDKLSNIAAGTNKPLSEFVDLYNKAKNTGKVDSVGLQSWAVKGVVITDVLKKMGVEVDRSSIKFEHLEMVLNHLTSEGGMFAGLMAEQMQNLSASMGQLQDDLTNVLNELGEEFQDVMKGGIELGSYVVGNYKEIGRVVLELVAAYGAYRAVLIVINSLNALNVKIMRQAVLEKRLAAAASINLSNAEAIAAARTKIFSLAQAGLAKSLKATAAALLPHPYVAMAAAVVALGYGIYKLSTYQTEAEKGVNRFNDAIKEAEKASLSETRTLSKLKGELSAVAKGTDEYNRIKEKIVSNYSKYYSGLAEEIDKVGLLDSTYKSLTKSIQSSFGARQYAKFMQAESDNLDEVMSENLGKIQDRLIDKLGDEAGSKYYSKIRAAIIDGTVSIGAGFKAQGLDPDTQAALDKASGVSDGDFIINKAVEGYIKNIIAAKKITDDLDARAKLKFGITDEDKIQEDNSTEQKLDNITKRVKEASESVSKLKKELADLRSGKTQVAEGALVEAIEEKAKELKAAEDKLASLTGVSSKETTTINNQKDKLKRLLDSQALEQIRSEEDLQNQVDQARIDAMDEGSSKYIAQMELNFEKELQAIDRQKEDALRKKIEDARTAFEADPKNKEKTFDASGIALTEQEVAQYDAQYKAVVDRIGKAHKELTEKYQDYEAQRLAIKKKYDEDIDALLKQRTQAEIEGNIKAIEEIDRAIIEATSKQGKELISFDFDILKKSPEYVRAFEDLKNTSSETLGFLLGKLEEMAGKAAEVLDPTELREYMTTIQDIMDELMSRDPFKALANSQKELTKANAELAAAKRNLNKALAGGNEEKIAEATDKWHKALDGVAKASNKNKKAQKEVNDLMAELYESLSKVGDAIGGTTGEIIGFIADIGSFVSTSIDGVKAVSQAGSQAISTVEKASVILAIISAAIQLIQQLGNLIKDSSDQYEKYAEKIAEVNKITEAVNDYKLAVLEARQMEESWFADLGVGKLRSLKEMNTAVLKTYNDLANSYQAKYENKQGSGWLTKAGKFGHDLWMTVSGQKLADSILGTNIDKTIGSIYGITDYDKQLVKAKDNLRIETKKAKKGFLGSGIGGKAQKTEDLTAWVKSNLGYDLFDEKGLLDVSAAKIVLDKYGNKLVGQTKETLETLIELKEQYDEYIEQLHEYVSSLYEPLVDNFIDSMWDWFDEGKDVLDSFKDYASNTFRDIVSDVMRTIAMSKIFDGFDDQLSDLYEKYASGDITEDELMKGVSELMDNINRKIETETPFMQNFMNSVNSAFAGIGMDLKGAESIKNQEATRKGFETMSQDTASELNGRFTALQMAGEEIKLLTGIIQMDVSELRRLGSSANEVLMDLRDIGLDTVFFLERISKNTAQLYIMNEKLDKVIDNTKNM